jgi:CRISP-associated protein Cas1
MPPLYVTEQGAKVGVRSRRLVITKDDETLAEVPMIKVDAVHLLGMVQVTTQAMRRLMQEGIDVIFLTQRGEYCGRLVGPDNSASALRRWQYRRSDEPDFCQQLGQAFVRGKLVNARRLLQQAQRKSGIVDAELSRGIEILGASIQRAPRTTTINGLMGVEGSGTAAYYRAFGSLLPDVWRFQRRVRRPPTDPINVLLSLGYTLLTHSVQSAILTVGLDPYVGFFHAQGQARPSLALDLVEEFRPLIVDRVVLSACSRRRITPEDFQFSQNAARPVVLSDEGRQRFFAELEARWKTTLQHPANGEQVTYRRSLELQVRQFARSLQTGQPYAPLTPR